MSETMQRAITNRPYEDFWKERIEAMAKDVPPDKAEWVYWVLMKAVYG